eukprot:TRINITY_DN851_c0_g3_i1.p1 TRINITY_DN851_c0_g3~~TRINITY_DN851_c0_g3_i1.p1  ORF type:complete len:1153 (+),score=419.20 TRINITY_DN851_c0_g3_i1:105-3563(+)
MTAPPENGTACDLGPIPEFLSVHCELDAEAIMVLALLVAMGVLVLGYMLVKLGTDRFNETEKERVQRDIRMRVTGRRAVSKETPGCSFAVTVTKPADQEWYRCRTCYGISEMGCCSVCAAKCHKGHDLEKSQSAHHRECRYCSCGASGRCLQNADFDKELKEAIVRYYVEADAEEKISAPTGVRFYWHAGVDRPYFSAVLNNTQDEEDSRIYEYDSVKSSVIAMGGPNSGHEEDTAEQAIAAEWDNVYNKIDIDGDGVLSSKEIQEYFQNNRELQEKLSVSDQISFDKLLKRLDSDGDGVVDRSEFAVLVQELGLVNNTPTSIEVAVNNARDLVAADTIGTSDPFVEVRGLIGFNSNTSQVTSVKQKNLNPIWNERFQLSLAPTAPQYQLGFYVYDKDKVGDPDFLGFADVKFAPNELATLAKKSQDRALRLGGRPSNAGDVQLVRLHRGKLGTLHVTLRAHVDQTNQIRTKKKQRDAGRTLCRECRRKMFFIPKASETKQWMDSQGHSCRLKMLPHCVCGSELLPDGWRDDLRHTFEQFRSADFHDMAKVERYYPLASHISLKQMVEYCFHVTLAAINIAGIILAWSERPARNPANDFNLFILCLTWGELIYLILVGLQVLYSGYLVGWWGMWAMLPYAILGAHSLKVLSVGWFPTRWLRRFQKMHQKTTLLQTRHFVARVGVAIGIIGCFFFLAPLPIYVLSAKLALFRQLYVSKGEVAGAWLRSSLNITSVIISMNLANNLRHAMDAASDTTPTELRLPPKLWLSVVTRLKGPEGERWRTVFGLLSFSPKERSLPLLYELFVLNRDSIFHSKKGAEEDDKKNETVNATETFGETTDLKEPLLDTKSAPGATDAGGTLMGDVGNWGHDNEKIRNEMERLELESIHARREVKKLQDEIAAMEAIQLTATSPVQMAVRRVLAEFVSQLSNSHQHQLQQGIAIAEGRNKDLNNLVKGITENPMLPDNVREILKDSLGGKYGVSRRAKEETFALPSPPVVFPPSRTQLRLEHSQPTSLTRASPGFPPRDVSNPLNPAPQEGDFFETTPLALPLADPPQLKRPVHDRFAAWDPTGSAGGESPLDSPASVVSPVHVGGGGGGGPLTRHDGLPSRTARAQHFSNLTRFSANTAPPADKETKKKREARRSLAGLPPHV